MRADRHGGGLQKLTLTPPVTNYSGDFPRLSETARGSRLPNLAGWRLEKLVSRGVIVSFCQAQSGSPARIPGRKLVPALTPKEDLEFFWEKPSICPLDADPETNFRNLTFQTRPQPAGHGEDRATDGEALAKQPKNKGKLKRGPVVPEGNHGEPPTNADLGITKLCRRMLQSEPQGSVLSYR